MLRITPSEIDTDDVALEKRLWGEDVRPYRNSFSNPEQALEGRQNAVVLYPRFDKIKANA